MISVGSFSSSSSSHVKVTDAVLILDCGGREVAKPIEETDRQTDRGSIGYEVALQSVPTKCISSL